MADNTILNTGAGGDTIATDDIAGIKYPRTKLVVGIDGINDGDVAATNPLPVDVIAALPDTAAGDFAAMVVDLAAIEALLITIDADTGSIDGKITACNTGAVVIASGTVTAVTTVTNLSQMNGAAIAMNEGVLGVGVQRVSLATDDDLVAHGATIAGDTTSIDGKITACNTGAVVISSGTITAVSSVTEIANALPAGTNNIGDVDVLTVPAPLSTTGGGTEATALRVTVASDSTGVLSIDDNGGALTVDNAGTFAVQVDAALPAGTNLIGGVNDRPSTSGGLSMYKRISTADTNGANIKASAGQVYAVQVMNTNSAARYLKLYDKATTPTVGTDTPVKTLLIPGNTSGAGLVLNWDKGLEFTSGIGIGLTTGITDADTGAVASNAITVNIDYE